MCSPGACPFFGIPLGVASSEIEGPLPLIDLSSGRNTDHEFPGICQKHFAARAGSSIWLDGPSAEWLIFGPETTAKAQSYESGRVCTSGRLQKGFISFQHRAVGIAMPPGRNPRARLLRRQALRPQHVGCRHSGQPLDPRRAVQVNAGPPRCQRRFKFSHAPRQIPFHRLLVEIPRRDPAQFDLRRFVRFQELLQRKAPA
jgi:hypothetical protein